MNPEEIAAAELVLEEMHERRPVNLSFGYFKRETEALIGRTLLASEAQELYAIVNQPKEAR